MKYKLNPKKTTNFYQIFLALAICLLSFFWIEPVSAAIPVTIVRDIPRMESELKHLKEASVLRTVLQNLATSLILNEIMESNDGLWVKNFATALYEPQKQEIQKSLDKTFSERFKDAPNAALKKRQLEDSLYKESSYTLKTDRQDIFKPSQGGGYDSFLEFVLPNNNDFGIKLSARNEAIKDANGRMITEKQKMGSSGYLPKENGSQVVTPSASVQQIANDTQTQRQARFNSNNCNDTVSAFVDSVADMVKKGMYNEKYSTMGGVGMAGVESLVGSILCAG